MKLLARGGSIAAGYGVAEGCVSFIRESLLVKGIEVVNRSRYREKTFDGVAMLYQDIDCFRPDVLFFHFGVDEAFQCVYRSEFQENLVQMIRLAWARFDSFILLATLHAFDDSCDMDAVYIFYRSLKIVANDLNCQLIPVHYYWTGYLEEHGLRNKNLVQPGTRYPNERGHRVIPEAVMSGLGKFLNQKGR